MKKKREDSMILMTMICNSHLTKKRNSLEGAVALILMMRLTIFQPPERNSEENHHMQEVWEEKIFKEIWTLMTRMIHLSSKTLKMREKYRTVTWRNLMKILSNRLIKGIIPQWVTQLQWAIRARQQLLLSIVSL